MCIWCAFGIRLSFVAPPPTICALLVNVAPGVEAAASADPAMIEDVAASVAPAAVAPDEPLAAPAAMVLVADRVAPPAVADPDVNMMSA